MFSAGKLPFKIKKIIIYVKVRKVENAKRFLYFSPVGHYAVTVTEDRNDLCIGILFIIKYSHY